MFRWEENVIGMQFQTCMIYFFNVLDLNLTIFRNYLNFSNKYKETDRNIELNLKCCS